MSGTRPDRKDTVDEERASFYVRTENGFEVAAPIDPSYKWGGGGMLSTVLDLVAFGQAHLEPGFLIDATLERVLTSQHTTEGDETGVGVGWRLARDAWGRRVAHQAGSMDGARSVVVVYPDEEVVVALMTNVALHPLAAEATAQMLADPFLRG